MNQSRINYLLMEWGIPAALIALGLTLSFALFGCAGVTLAEVQTTADKLITNVKSYAQTLANMLQTASADIAKAAPQLVSVANLGNAIANDWGMAPASPQQQDTYNKVLTDISLIGNNASALNSLLTSISTSGVVPTITTAGDSSTMIWDTPTGIVAWTKTGNGQGRMTTYAVPMIALDNSISAGVQ